MGKEKQKPGLNRDAWLVRDLFDEKKLIQTPTRNGFGEGLVQAGRRDKNVVVLCADLTESTRVLAFKEAFPDRFVQLGVSEQSMPSIAAGMAMAGKVPFIASYACFSPGRNWEQIRTTVALNNTNVKIVGAHAGVSVGPDGATHQMVEDIAIMRVMPNMRVVVPCDSRETRKATEAIAKLDGSCYLRFAREKSPVFTTEKTLFKVGRAEIFRHGSDVTIIGAGPLLYEALLAAERLSQDLGVECAVINMHTVKPLDVHTIIRAAKETGAIVTVEEAQAAGGLAGAVAETLALTIPVPMERVGVQDRFGESGTPREIQEGLGLTAEFIALAVDRVLSRKRGERVPDVLAHVSAAQEKLQKMQAQSLSAALKKAPRKWK
jgi:transketolase